MVTQMHFEDNHSSIDNADDNNKIGCYYIIHYRICNGSSIVAV